MKAKVVFHSQAQTDLFDLYSYIRDRSATTHCKGLRRQNSRTLSRLLDLPRACGLSRPDLGANVRVVGFEGRVSIVFSAEGPDIVILGIFYGGRSIRIEGSQPRG